MEKSICEDDLFICNPGFSINMFGLRLPGKKICYVQGFTSYDVLDVFYDRFAFSSKFVKEYVQKWRYYDINGPVINPFIHTEVFAGGQEWHKRKASVMVLHHKGLTKPLVDEFERLYRKKYPHSCVAFEHYRGLRQQELADIMGHHKYYLSLSPLEGFGLPMLEAMASGCAVVGFDGWGGRDYIVNQVNAMTDQYPHLETLVDYLYELTQDDGKARKLGENGYVSSRVFNRERFDSQWSEIVDSLAETNGADRC
jgi:hypothetical protein